MRRFYKMFRRFTAQCIEIWTLVISRRRNHIFLCEIYNVCCRQGSDVRMFWYLHFARKIYSVNVRRKCAYNVVRPFKQVFHHDVAAQILHSVFFLFCCYAARGTARPSVLVVKPRFHIFFFRRVGAGVYIVEPFIGQIFRRKSGSRMHKKASEAHFLHNFGLPYQFFFVEFSVPSPERLCSVFSSVGFAEHPKTSFRIRGYSIYYIIAYITRIYNTQQRKNSVMNVNIFRNRQGLRCIAPCFSDLFFLCSLTTKNRNQQKCINSFRIRHWCFIQKFW